MTSASRLHLGLFRVQKMLSHSRLLDVLHYDKSSGVFTWKDSRNPGIPSGSKAGTVGANGYVQIKVDGRLYQAHVLAFLYVTGEFSAHSIDHINGSKADNKWVNLREATHSQNLQNQRCAHRGTRSGFLGVSVHRASGKFQATIVLNGKQSYLGLFERAESAHAAYVAAKRTLHEFSTI